jgi:hypothetical protein
MAPQVMGLSGKWVTGGEAAVEAHALIQNTLGAANVEDLDSFKDTVAPSDDYRVTTRMLCASDDHGIVAVVVGARLARLNAAMLLYSAVRKDARRKGVYTKMRSKVLDGLRGEDARPLDYIVSELEPGGVLWRCYHRRFDAWVAPCDYRVPNTQGLTPRPLDLVIVPLTKRPELGDIAGIVREIYEGVYRLLPADASVDYRSVVQSIPSDGPETGLRGALR